MSIGWIVSDALVACLETQEALFPVIFSSKTMNALTPLRRIQPHAEGVRAFNVSNRRLGRVGEGRLPGGFSGF